MGALLSCLTATTKTARQPRNEQQTAAPTSTKAKAPTQVQGQPPLGQTPHHPPFSNSQDEAASAGQQDVHEEHSVAAVPATGTKDAQKAAHVETVPIAPATNRDRDITPARGEKKAPGAPDKMASDEDYSAFLDQANRDPNEGMAKGQSQGKGKVELRAVDDGAKVPARLQDVTKDAFYVSDADEPFEPVCLKLRAGKGGLPNEAAFAKAVSHPSPEDADVAIMDIGEWDTQGQYKELVDATREVTKGSDVRVYRIGREGSRVEYWVVGVESGRLLGVKALAIES